MPFLSFIAYLLVRLLNATLRVQQVHPENLEKTPQYILAFWHAQVLPMLGRSRWRRPISVMVSRSGDGELIARVLGWFRVSSSRGSSSRGGSSALRELIRETRSGRNIVFTPDGPRGPARIAKEGLVYASQATGVPVVPVAFAVRRKKLLRSWDRMIIPVPFTRGVCVYGPPIVVPRDGDVEDWRLKIEQQLNALSEEAERMVQQ